MKRLLQPAVTVLSFVLLCPGSGPADDFSTQLMRATCKLSVANTASTAFLLCRPAPEDPSQKQLIMITAGHALEAAPAEQATLHWRKKQPDGSYKKQPVTVSIRKDGKPLWSKHPSADVAAMLVALPEGVDVPDVPVDVLATDEMLTQSAVHPGDTLQCLGFPHQFEANPSGFAVLRSGTISSFPLLPTKVTKTFLLSSNVFEGDSGGPVFLAEPNRLVDGKPQPQPVRLILGLVAGQHFLDEDLKSPYEIRKVRHRLGLAIIPHASFIRETLEALGSPAEKKQVPAQANATP